MSDKAAKLISAGLFALALSYFVTNVREVHRLGEDTYVIVNHLVGTQFCSYYRCFTLVLKDGAEREAAAEASAAEEEKRVAKEKAAAEEADLCRDPAVKEKSVSCLLGLPPLKR